MEQYKRISLGLTLHQLKVKTLFDDKPFRVSAPFHLTAFRGA